MLTCDSLFDGRLTVYQTRDGYRLSIDSVLLAGLTRVEAGDRITLLHRPEGAPTIAFANRIWHHDRQNRVIARYRAGVT